MKKILLVSALLLVCLSIFMSVPLYSCSVPVFRYALERWQPSPYEIVIFYEKSLSANDKLLIKMLNEHEAGEKANITVRPVDITLEMDDDTSSIWKSVKQKKLPVMAVFYPFLSFGGELSRSEIPAAWYSGLTEKNIKLVLDSPVRRELARQMLKGVSVVWLLIESGDKNKDAAAEKALLTESARLEKSIKLPEPVETDYLYLDKLKLKLSLSVMKVSRTDPNEILLIKSLLNSSKEMKNIKEPVAFPVFGKGRVFYPLAGMNIKPEKIQKTVEFLAGPCACTIKEQNPGMDLLMSIKWGSLITSTLSIDKELPPLKGLAGFVDIKQNQTMEVKHDVEKNRKVTHSVKTNYLLRNVIMLLLVLIFTALAWYVYYNKNK